MLAPAGISRVVVVVLDGLRADVVPLYQLPELGALAAAGAATFTAQTVRPSVTISALTSLLTGVSPAVHGMVTDRIGLPRHPARLTPLSRVLESVGVPTFGYRAALPLGFGTLGRQVAAGLGADLSFGGRHAAQILDRAMPRLSAAERGFFLLHWPDADDAGHARGWASRHYLHAVERYDRAIGRLVRETAVLTDPSSVLIVLADHGGGGRVAHDHNSEHPLDGRIPLIIAGGQVRRGALAASSSLLDVPATVPWLFGAETPASYQGRILREAFRSLMPVRQALEVAA